MKKLFLALIVVFPLFAVAQRITPEEYIQTYKDIAMREMRDHGIPASITLAQGLIESGAGNSPLARKAKNHFGIKCHGWTGKTYYMDDDEKDECFRKYKSVDESYRDHSTFLSTRARYASLFDLEITDYKSWARGLKAAGYATNPRYAKTLIKCIELYDLTKYDRIALGLETDDGLLPEIDPDDELIELAYSPADRSVFELVDMTADKRFIYENNGVRFVFAKEGETPESMAQELNIPLEEFCEYNCVHHPDVMVFHSGDVVYIAPLRIWNWKAKSHIAEEGETVRDVALRYAVKPERILKRNKLYENIRLRKGKEIKLR